MILKQIELSSAQFVRNPDWSPHWLLAPHRLWTDRPTSETICPTTTGTDRPISLWYLHAVNNLPVVNRACIITTRLSCFACLPLLSTSKTRLKSLKRSHYEFRITSNTAYYIQKQTSWYLHAVNNLPVVNHACVISKIISLPSRAAGAFSPSCCGVYRLWCVAISPE